MPVFLLKLLGSPRVLIILMIVAIVGTATYKMKSQANTIERQKIEIHNVMQEKVQAQEEMKSAVRATEELQNRIEESSELAEQVDEIEGEINNAKPEEDGEVAPVLRTTLSAIDRLRDNENSSS